MKNYDAKIIHKYQRLNKLHKESSDLKKILNESIHSFDLLLLDSKQAIADEMA